VTVSADVDEQSDIWRHLYVPVSCSRWSAETRTTWEYPARTADARTPHLRACCQFVFSLLLDINVKNLTVYNAFFLLLPLIWCDRIVVGTAVIIRQQANSNNQTTANITKDDIISWLPKCHCVVVFCDVYCFTCTQAMMQAGIVFGSICLSVCASVWVSVCPRKISKTIDQKLV